MCERRLADCCELRATRGWNMNGWDDARRGLSYPFSGIEKLLSIYTFFSINQIGCYFCGRQEHTIVRSVNCAYMYNYKLYDGHFLGDADEESGP